MEENARAWSVVKRCLYDEVPPQRVSQVTAWAMNQKGTVCGVDLNTLTSADDLPNKRELGRNLYDAYRSARQIPICRHPENIQMILEYLAVDRLHCENFGALEQHDERLASDLHTYVTRFLWHNEFLHNQALYEIPYVGNTIYQKMVGPNLTDLQRQRLEDRRLNGKALATDVRSYSRDQLRVAIVEFLKANRTTDFTYGQLAERIGCKHQYHQVSSVLFELAKEPQSGVVFIKKLIKVMPGAEQKSDSKHNILWKYAPERKKNMAHPDQRDDTLESLILKHIGEYAEADATNRSGLGIRNAMRALLGKVSNEKVTTILANLVQEGKIVPSPGLRRGIVYSLALQIEA